jgi:hypothetical protein
MNATPSPAPSTPNRQRRTPLDELGGILDDVREDLARLDAMLPRETRERDRGEHRPQ